MNNKKKSSFSFIYALIILLICILAIFAFVDLGSNIDETQPSNVIEMIQDGQVEELYFYNGEGRVLLTVDNSKFKTEEERERFPDNADFYFEYTSTSLELILNAVDTYNATAENDIVWENPPVRSSWFETLMPILYIALACVAVFLIFRMFAKSNNSAMQFGKNKARVTSDVKVRFSDIAGADEEKWSKNTKRSIACW